MAADYTIFPRQGRKYLYVQFRVGEKRQPAVSSKCTSKASAIRWANAELQKRIRLPAGRDLTLGQYAKPFFTDSCPYLTRRREDGRVFSVEYIRGLKDYKERFILPDKIAAIPLLDLRRKDVLEWRTRLLKKLGPRRMIWHILGALKVILNQAVFEETLEYSPASMVSNPDYKRTPRKALPLDKLKSMLSPGFYDDPRHWMATVLAAYTGMRAGEVCGLQWGDIDYAHGIIHILRAVKDKGAKIGPPKSGKPRTTALPATLSAMLKEWKKRAPSSQWIFGYSENRLLGYSHWSVAVARAAKKAGCPGTTLHILRHTLNTYLRGKVSDAILQHSFGWSGDPMQENYTDTMQIDYSAQAQAVESILGGNLELANSIP